MFSRSRGRESASEFVDHDGHPEFDQRSQYRTGIGKPGESVFGDPQLEVLRRHRAAREQCLDVGSEAAARQMRAQRAE
jgi:hypothetical protein